MAEENYNFDVDAPSGNGGKPKDSQASNILGGLFQTPNFTSAIKELVHPGKEPKELLMRTILTDVNEARDLALTLAKCDEFGMEQEKQLLLYLLAARTSVGGKARTELLQGITGTYSPQRNNKLGIPFGKKSEGQDGQQ